MITYNLNVIGVFLIFLKYTKFINELIKQKPVEATLMAVFNTLMKTPLNILAPASITSGLIEETMALKGC